MSPGHLPIRCRAEADSVRPVFPSIADALVLAAEEIERLQQGIWDAYRILGFDTDGDPTPAALTHPHLADLIVQAATEHRADYDEATR